MKEVNHNKIQETFKLFIHLLIIVSSEFSRKTREF